MKAVSSRSSSSLTSTPSNTLSTNELPNLSQAAAYMSSSSSSALSYLAARSADSSVRELRGYWRSLISLIR